MAEEKGGKVIVIQPGSRTLRIGLASDFQPLSITNAIAFRQRGQVAKEQTTEKSSPRKVDTKAVDAVAKEMRKVFGMTSMSAAAILPEKHDKSKT
jgi:actin-related protein